MGKRASDTLQREINHAALAYLNQWYRTDRRHMLGESDRLTGEALRKVAAKYMVARGISMKDARGKDLPKPERERRWNDAARLVTKARRLRRSDVAIVSKLSEQLGELDSRHHDLTSAATKFLWFAGRHSVRILDIRATWALRQLDQPARGTELDYGWFEQAWAEQAERCCEEVDMAISNLPKQFHWSEIPRADEPKALQAAISQPWFKDRVFDKYLWTKGERIKA